MIQTSAVPICRTKALHFVNDLRLGRDIERRRRLVGDDQVGLVEHRDGDGDALAHAARELMRIGAQALVPAPRCRPSLERLSPHSAHAARDSLRCAGMASTIWSLDAQQRMQRRHRILEDHGDAIRRGRARSSRSSRPARSCPRSGSCLRQSYPGGSIKPRME